MKLIVSLLAALVFPIFAAEPIRVLVWDEQQPQQKLTMNAKTIRKKRQASSPDQWQ
jgi:hypothetical protein